jgi:hypothetical protein
MIARLWEWVLTPLGFWASVCVAAGCASFAGGL